MRRTIPSLFLLIGLLLHQTAAGRSTICDFIFPSWERRVSEADFVGIVECDGAGVFLTKHHVVETWKGKTPQSSIFVHPDPFFFSETAGLSLCGERFVVALKRSEAKIIGRAYEYGAMMGSYQKIDADGKGYSSTPDRIKALKKTTTDFVSATPDLQAVLVIQAEAAYTRTKPVPEDRKAVFKALDPVFAQIASVTNIAQVVDAILEGNTNPQIHDFSYLLQTGGKPLLAYLEKHPTLQFPRREETIKELRLSKLFEPYWTDRSDVTTPKNNPEQAMKNALAWLPKEKDSKLHAEEGYEYIRMAIRYQGLNRKAYLLKLLKAEDPMVRTGAAIYLAKHDQKAATPILNDAMKQDGVAGVWAAFALVQRGHKEAMPQALELLNGLSDKNSQQIDSIYREWYKMEELLAILSNSAKASKVPQPTAPYDVWWQKYGDKITLHDPWLAEMDRLKID